MDIAAIVLIVLVAAVLFGTERVPVDVVALLVLCALLLSGVLTTGEGMVGFGSPATLTVAAMFVLSAGLSQTGALTALGQALIRHGKNETWLLVLVMLGTAVVSPFINNTAAVAVFLPLVVAAARSRKVAPSKLLIPLSFASQFGGVCTLVGTSTNLVVNAFAETAGLRGFSLFEFAGLGAIMVVSGTVYFLLVGRHLLPERGPSQLTEAYDLGEYITELRVMPDSPLVGKTVTESKLGEAHDITVLEILRGERAIWSLRSEALVGGDVLLVRGEVKELFKLKEAMGLEMEPQFRLEDSSLKGGEMEMVEAVVAPRSDLVGRTLRKIDFYWRYKSVVLALHRRGHALRKQVASVRLRVGDALLLLGPRETIARLRDDQNFILLGPRRDVAVDRRGAPVALGIVGAVMLLVALKLLPVATAALLGCAAMALARCIRPEDAYRAIDWRVIILLAGVFPLGLAIEKTGAARMLVDGALEIARGAPPEAVLCCLYVMTAVLTEVMSNNAAAAILAPVAISTAAGLGLDPRPFLVAVTFAASTSFATPVGYQTNTMVYNAGGYRFADFLRVGIPLNILFCVLATIFIPRFWPF